MWKYCFSQGMSLVQNHKTFYLKPNLTITQPNDSSRVVLSGDVAMNYLHKHPKVLFE